MENKERSNNLTEGQTSVNSEQTLNDEIEVEAQTEAVASAEQAEQAEKTQEEAPKKPPMKKGDKAFFIVASIIAVMLASYILLFNFVFLRIEVGGRSMQPTLDSGEILIANRLSKVERGDVIILKEVKNEYDWLIKRAIGIEGDVVEIENGKVYLNGEELDEPYILNADSTFAPDCTNLNDVYKMTYTLGEDEVFFLGDNRLDSLDGRYYGVCVEENVVGVVSEFAISIKETTTVMGNFLKGVKKFFGIKR